MSPSQNDSKPLGAQVLIVEDEADHADVMADALRKPGHVCTIVNDVAGGKSRCRGVLRHRDRLVIEDGRVVAFGPHAELLRDVPRYSEVLAADDAAVIT